MTVAIVDMINDWSMNEFNDCIDTHHMHGYMCGTGIHTYLVIVRYVRYLPVIFDICLKARKGL